MAHGGWKNIWLIGRGEKGFDMYSSEYLMLLKLEKAKQCSLTLYINPFKNKQFDRSPHTHSSTPPLPFR